nr:histidine kinase [Micromonospora sp. DSM 115978]
MPYRGSFGLVVTLHVLLAVFVVGPLAFATAFAPWLLLRRRALADDGGRRAVVAGLVGTTWAVRGLSAIAVLAGGLGFVVLDEGTFGSVRSVSDPWILYSIVLWALAILINLVPLDRLLTRARSAVALGEDPQRLAAPLAVAGAGITVLAVGWLVAAADIEPRAAIGWVFFRIGASVMSAALGESVRSRRVIAADAVERAELAERTREEEARARVDAERLRIAREVHDTVAHAIAIINVQSGVTAHVLDKRPEQVREALRAIEQTSARALREMRSVLGVLRDDDHDSSGERGGRTPFPGLAQIDELTTKARDAGLDVKIEENA